MDHVHSFPWGFDLLNLHLGLTGFSSILLGTSLIIYAILTTIFTVYILVLKRRPL